MDIFNLKQEIYLYCQQKINAQLAIIRQSLEDFQQSANEETKSSAGDKYETGRAMMNLEKEKAMLQWTETDKLIRVLNQIHPEKTQSEAGLGSLVETDHGFYFLSVGLGRIELDSSKIKREMNVFAISLISPIGQCLSGSHAGDEVLFNGKKIKIRAIA